jgi:hypothetical protein
MRTLDQTALLTNMHMYRSVGSGHRELGQALLSAY